jgi:hypothetical protein
LTVYGKACFLFYYALPAVIRSKTFIDSLAAKWQIGSLWQIGAKTPCQKDAMPDNFGFLQADPPFQAWSGSSRQRALVSRVPGKPNLTAPSSMHNYCSCSVVKRITNKELLIVFFEGLSMRLYPETKQLYKKEKSKDIERKHFLLSRTAYLPLFLTLKGNFADSGLKIRKMKGLIVDRLRIKRSFAGWPDASIVWNRAAVMLSRIPEDLAS